MIGVGGNYNGRCVYGGNCCVYTCIHNPYLSLLHEWNTTKRKNPDDYIEINKSQRDKDIAQVKAQDKYDNDWGYIR